jgi:transposase
MRFVPVKTAEHQSILMLHSTRDLLIHRRIQLVNALRANLAEFGLVAEKRREGRRDAEIPDVVPTSRRAREGAPRDVHLTPVYGRERNAAAGHGERAHARTLPLLTLWCLGRRAVHFCWCRNATRTMSAQGMAHG